MQESQNNEHIDVLKGIDYKIIQDSSKFCFGIDAVLVSHYAKESIKSNYTVFDLGTGNAIIPLLINAKCSPQRIYGIEIQEQAVDMARRSVALNNLDEKITILNEDIKNLPENLKTYKHTADVVISNPPYMNAEHGKPNPNESKRIARHEVLCSFEDVVKATDFLLKPKGKFFLIHRPFRLAEIITTLTAYNLEPKKMQLIQPSEGKEPNIVMLQAVKGGKSRITVDATLNVYGEDGKYSDRVSKIYEEIFCK